MSNGKALRKLLTEQKASWSIHTDLADSTLLRELAQGHYLGALPVSPSMRTTHLPRLRSPVDTPVVPAQPGTSRLLRRGAPGAEPPAAWHWRNVNGKSYCRDRSLASA